jgi:hypothetical protein
MTISKRNITILGIVIIWLFALLNRIHIYNMSEVIPAKAYNLISTNGFVFMFTYNGISYEKVVEKELPLEDRGLYKLLIKRENPNDFIILNFWGFVFNTILISCFVTLVWLLFVQVFFENIESFQLLFPKK